MMIKQFQNFLFKSGDDDTCKKHNAASSLSMLLIGGSRGVGDFGP